MNSTTLEKLQSAAVFLSTPTAQTARAYLDVPYKFALNVLDTLKDGKPKTCQEIADLINHPPSHTSVNQLLMALEKGGIIFMKGEGNPLSRTWALPRGKIDIKGKRGD